MARVLRSRLAEQDIYNAWSYIEKDNPRAAEKLIDQLSGTFEFLARHDGIGSPRPHIDSTARVFPVGRYLIIFKRLDDGIEVLRVAHSGRDLKKLKLQ